MIISRQTYLQAMGIQTWVPRASLPDAKASFNYCCYLLKTVESNQTKAVLILNHYQGSQEVHHLLEKMIAAISMCLVENEFQTPQQLNEQSLPLLIMGKDLANDLTHLFQRHVTVTYHPQELLQHSSLKREAWQHLQAFQKAINDNA